MLDRHTGKEIYANLDIKDLQRIDGKPCAGGNSSVNSDVEIELGRQILKAHVNQNKYFRFRGRAVKPAVNPELRARGCLSQKLATAASPQR